MSCRFNHSSPCSQAGARWSDLWTFRRNNLLTQVDYILVQNSLRRRVIRSGVWRDFSTGSDHRAVFMVMTFGKRPGGGGQRNGVQIWKRSSDINAYQTALADKLSIQPVDFTSLSHKAKFLEDQILGSCTKSKASAEAERKFGEVEHLSDEIRALIAQRRGCSDKQGHWSNAAAAHTGNNVHVCLKLTKIYHGNDMYV